MTIGTKITFIRHSKTAEPKANQRDDERTLTEEGRTMASELGTKLIKNHGTPDLILTSGVTRTIQTAEEMKSESRIPVLDYLQLFVADDARVQTRLEEMFEELGHTTLQAYREADSEEAFARFIQRGADAISKCISDRGAFNIWVVGHSVYLPGLAHQLAHILLGYDDAIKLRTWLLTNPAMKECEYYHVSRGWCHKG